jgi:membrane-associated phospholipid phosphatase
MDRAISNFFINNRPAWLGHLAEYVTYLGQFPIHVVVIVVLAVALRKRVEVLGVAVIAAVFAYGLNSVLKKLFDRARPLESRWFQNYEAHGFSLPSGHAVNAAVLGTFIFLWLDNKWRWSGPFVAVAVMWSRVELGVHWPSDVLVGGVIGATIAITSSYLTPRLTSRSA